MWRWDQGRLGYFSIQKIRQIAIALNHLDGVALSDGPDPLRLILEKSTALPFAPSSYKVWRNYARVFKVLGLASKVNDRLLVTNLCRRLIKTEDEFLSYDDYLSYLAKSFYYPSPVFTGYNTHDPQTFPFLAILKYLIANQSTGTPSISVEGVFSKLIANKVTGLETVSSYMQLTDKEVSPNGDQQRQVREMLIFISQLSYLTWIDGRLYLSLPAQGMPLSDEVEKNLQAHLRPRQSDPELEIQNLGSAEDGEFEILVPDAFSSVDDVLFTEGRKVRVSHLRTERNRRLIQFYFQNAAHPQLCDVCQIEVVGRYPWMENLIEVHHVLPLASPLNIHKDGTSLDDLVGLCPNCHRATHAYYRVFLKANTLPDFESEAQAREVYLEVKDGYVVA